MNQIWAKDRQRDLYHRVEVEATTAMKRIHVDRTKKM